MFSTGSVSNNEFLRYGDQELIYDFFILFLFISLGFVFIILLFYFARCVFLFIFPFCFHCLYKKSHILYLAHLKGNRATFTFQQKAWYESCLVFLLLAFKVVTAKKLFSFLWYLRKNSLYYILFAITLNRFHSLNVWLRSLVSNTNAFFISRTKYIYAKILTLFKTTFKIKAMHIV